MPHDEDLLVLGLDDPFFPWTSTTSGKLEIAEMDMIG